MVIFVVSGKIPIYGMSILNNRSNYAINPKPIVCIKIIWIIGLTDFLLAKLIRSNFTIYNSIPSSAYHKKFQLDYNKIVQSFYSSRSCSTQQPSIYIDASLYCFYYKETILMFNILHFVFKENTEGLF